jgi:hypothetical protein
MYTRIIGVFVFCLFIFTWFGCQNEKKITTNEGKTIAVAEGKEGIPSVCIWDKATVRSEPSQKGKWISSIALGEKILCLGEDKIDSSDKNRKYYKVRLSDGKEGWVSEYSLSIDAKPSVAMLKTPIYLRPDLVTVTDKEFTLMEFIAVSKPENEWCEAKGSEGKKKGWIKSSSVSFKDEDITVALLAGKALAETDKDRKRQKIESIVNNPAFSGSIFINSLNSFLEEMTPGGQGTNPPPDSLDR